MFFNLFLLLVDLINLLGWEASTAWNDKANVSDKPGETTQLSFYGVGGWSRPAARVSDSKDGSSDSRDGFKEGDGLRSRARDGEKSRSRVWHDEHGGGFREGTGEGTRAIARTRVGTPALVVTDMPGFGFAFLNEGTHTHRPCTDIMKYYLTHLIYRNTLHPIVLIQSLLLYPLVYFSPSTPFSSLFSLAETLRCREVTRAYLHGSPTTTTTTNANPSPGASPGSGASPGPFAISSPSPSPSPRPRASLKRVLFLVDGRHGLKPTDATFLQQLFNPVAPENSGGDGGDGHDSDSDSNSSSTSYNKRQHMVKASPKWKLQVVLTKCDLVERNDLARRMAAVHAQLR